MEFFGFRFPYEVSALELTPFRDEKDGSECALFPHYISFEEAIFAKEADFSNATFKQNVHFSHVEFKGRACFENADFEKQAIFLGARFESGASYEGTFFEGRADFTRATFLRDTKFTGEILEHALFSECQTSGTVTFHLQGFNGHIVWRWVLPQLNKPRSQDGHSNRGLLLIKQSLFNENATIDLRFNDIESDSCVRLELGDMSNVLLSGTDCYSIDISPYAKWPTLHDAFFNLKFLRKLPKWPWITSKRDACGDEFMAKRKADDLYSPALVRQVYQQLSKKYRDRLDFVRAVEFDRGAFEMRRLEAREEKGLRGWSTYIWLSLYKYASHYSGNLVLPTIWMMLTILLWAVLYHSLLGIGDYKIAALWDGSLAWDGLQYSLRVTAFDRSWFKDVVYESNLSGGRTTIIQLLSILQTVVVATLAALFGFALRRRIKH